MTDTAGRLDWRRGGVAGALAAAAALAVAEFVARVVPGASSPVVAAGGAIIDLAPPAARDLSITLFGTSNKLGLTLGTALAVLGLGVVVGAASVRRFSWALAAIAALGAVGVAAGVADRASEPLPTAVVAILSAAVAAGTLRWLLGPAIASDDAARAGPPGAGPPDAGHLDAGSLDAGRRQVIAGVGVAVAGAAAFSATGRWRLLFRTTQAPTRQVTLPEPVRTVAPPGVSHAHDVAGLERIVVPNDSFFRIDTALTVPRVDASQWRLRVTGMVDRELTINLNELLAMPMVEKYVTIACVSNEVGGRLIGNAKWTGVPLRELLERAGIRPGAGQVVGRSVDGWTAGFPTEVVLDGRESLVAVGMNGEPLPAQHGFPARLIVPGLYGYVSATKWLTEVELTTWDGYDAYWVPRGWAKRGPIKTQSRIDVPRGGARVPAGEVVIAGMAWAPLNGVDRVEVRVDDGAWQDTAVTVALSDAAWVQWRTSVGLAPGRHRLTVRATDGTGEVQTSTLRPPRPDGATGHHTINVTAT